MIKKNGCVFDWRWKIIKKCYDIWDKVSNNIKKELSSESIYNKKFLKTKIKYYGDETTDFHDEEMSKIDYNHICLEVVIIDFVLKKDKNYYPQVFLEEWKWIENEKRWQHILQMT